MSSTLMAASGLPWMNGLMKTTLPLGAVRRKLDQPNHSSVGAFSCASAGADAGQPTTVPSASSADTNRRVNRPARRESLIVDPPRSGRPIGACSLLRTRADDGSGRDDKGQVTG